MWRRNGELQFGTDGSPVQGQHGIEFTIKGLNVLQSENRERRIGPVGQCLQPAIVPKCAIGEQLLRRSIGSTIRSFVARRSASRLVVRLYPLTPRTTDQTAADALYDSPESGTFRLHFAASTGFTSPVILRHT